MNSKVLNNARKITFWKLLTLSRYFRVFCFSYESKESLLSSVFPLQHPESENSNRRWFWSKTRTRTAPKPKAYRPSYGEYCRKISSKLPKLIRRFLGRFRRCHLFGLLLFGLSFWPQLLLRIPKKIALVKMNLFNFEIKCEKIITTPSSPFMTFLVTVLLCFRFRCFSASLQKKIRVLYFLENVLFQIYEGFFQKK